jgi:tyrosyl-tRNA synthetase
MGGSDQWGNIISGIDLGRRLHNAQLFALTSPLITTSSGAKMGKTAAGAVWLDPRMTSQYDFWQYWRNVEDADVSRFLKLFTTLPLEEIQRLSLLRDREINEAKKILATEVTTRVYDEVIAKSIEETARETFEEGGLGANLPTAEIAGGDLTRGFRLIDAAVLTGLVPSNGEARRVIRGGGLKVNDETIYDEWRLLTLENLTPERVIKLSLGKKRHALLKIKED